MAAPFRIEEESYVSVQAIVHAFRDARRAGDQATAQRIGTALYALLEAGRVRAARAGDAEVVGEMDRLMGELEEGLAPSREQL